MSEVKTVAVGERDAPTHIDRLEAGVVKLPGAIMQNVTHIAPAMAAFFFTHDDRRILRRARAARLPDRLHPRARARLCLVQLAKNFPSAGGYFTYVSRTLGPRPPAS